MRHPSALVAACYSRICRPPTSGGTGGSLPRGAAGAEGRPSAPARGTKTASKTPKKKDVPSVGKPIFRRTAFTEKVEAAIRAEPALMRAPSSHKIAEMAAERYRSGLEANRQRDIQRWKNNGLIFEVSPSVAGSADARRAVAKEIGMSDSEIKSMTILQLDKVLKDWHVKTIDEFLNNPDRQPTNRIEQGYFEYARHLRPDEYESSAKMSEKLSSGLFDSRLGIKEILGVQNSAPWEKAYIQFPSNLSSRPRNEPIKWDEGIDAEYEAASTRVGAIVRDEYKARMATRIEEERVRIDTQVKSIESELVKFISKELGMEISPQWMRMSNYDNSDAVGVIVNIPSAVGRERSDHVFGVGLSTPAKALPDDIVKMIKDSGLNTLRFDIAFSNAATRIGKKTFMEVMEEVRPMGGVFADTPNHRKTFNGYSANEQLTMIAQRYPSDWIDASNTFGRVKYAITSSRQHYRHSKTTEPAEVTLDKGSVSTGVHEMGHRMEATVWGLSALEQVFFDRRTQGEQTQPLQQLLKGEGYGRDERAKPDKFFHPYAGKVYGDGFHEVFTVGIEEIAMRKAGRNVNGPIDDDYMAFMFGALSTLYREPL